LTTPVTYRSDGGLDEDAIRLQLQRILAGEGFKRSERICRFLSYAVEQTLQGHGGELKESVLAVEVYDRPADYNPKIDPIVRNDARRLRAKLREYYESEGSSDPVIIEIPKGSYLSVFRKREALPGESTASPWSVRQVLKLLSRRQVIAVGAAALLVAGFALYWAGRQRGPRSGSPVSIAVLPFITLGPDAGSEYLSDGLTEDLINALANVDGLRVPARTSAFAFKGKQLDIRDIGARLNVDMVLEGSVRKEGDQLRVSARLSKVADGYQVWSANYDREFKDALNIENEIAEAIATTLRFKIANNGAGQTSDLEAHNLYLQGHYFHSQGGGNPDVQKRAIAYFKQAIAKDAKYALPWAEMSDSWLELVIFGDRDPATFSAAETAAKQALQADETLSEAHVSLANVLVVKRDWAAADREFKRAIELDPRNTKALLDYATKDLALTDRLPQAIEQTDRALILDPVSPDVNGLRALVLICARRYDEAIQQARKSLEMHPQDIGVQNLLGRAYVQKGMLPQAVAEFHKAEELGVRRAHWAASMAELYVKSGRRAEAEKMLATWSSRPSQEFGHAESMAMIYAGLGKKDEAFQWLNQAYREHWDRLPWIKIEPEYDSLRDDPRFSALLDKMGLDSRRTIAWSQ
jgi:TolB-like protein/Flp pilus assembly protein TadD